MVAVTSQFAAQYLRMSTEHQQYSTENQALAIEEYAQAQGFEIVQTYLDTAKSGVILRRRTGLQRLLQDVVQGNCRYRAILVYDVSRWGRFQDSDEAAHYEFVYKSAGIPVHYCAETFANDGSMSSLIMKALKRTMAGEYSRELGSKVLAGQRRLAQLGFKQGGRAGYGLRRVLVTPDRRPKQTLASASNAGRASYITCRGPRGSCLEERRSMDRRPTLGGEKVRHACRKTNGAERCISRLSRVLRDQTEPALPRQSQRPLV
jgi:DNA invertase Pin-like site-specific DNA recombinase